MRISEERMFQAEERVTLSFRESHMLDIFEE